MIVGEDYNFHNSAIESSTILETITNNQLLEDTTCRVYGAFVGQMWDHADQSSILHYFRFDVFFDTTKICVELTKKSWNLYLHNKAGDLTGISTYGYFYIIFVNSWKEALL